MPYLELSNPTTNSCDYKVRLSNPFNTDYYRRLRITSTNYGDETSYVSRYVESVTARSSSSKNVYGEIDNGLSAGRTYRLYAYAQARNGTWYLAGSDRITMKDEDHGDIKVSFASGIDSSVVSNYSIDVIKQILSKSNLTSAMITSTIRPPSRQARIMYDNCEIHGTDSQYKLYGKAGDKVIDVYVAGKAAGKTRDVIIQEMTDKIIDLLPTRVSKHCVSYEDYAQLNVIDIGMSSISNKTAFENQLEAAKSQGILSKFLIEDNLNCYHLEIPVP